MAIIKQFPKQSRFTKTQSAPTNRFAKTQSAPTNRFAKTQSASTNRFAKTESNLNTRVNLLLGSLTFTAVASFAIVQLAPSDYAAQNQNRLETLNQIQGSESAVEESEFNVQQLDDLNSITNNTMMMDDHYNY